MSDSQKLSNTRFYCDKCKKDFTTNYGLKIHINGVHLKVKFDCEFCDYQCTTKSTLKTHINTVHLKLKPFQCDECDFSCGQSADLKKHVDATAGKNGAFRSAIALSRFFKIA